MSAENEEMWLRERISTTPRPAVLWLVGVVVLVVLELGRIADGVVRAGEIFRAVLGLIAAVPQWVGRNVAAEVPGGLGLLFGNLAVVITAALIALLAAPLFVRMLPGGSIAERYDLGRTEEHGMAIDWMVVVGILLVGFAALAYTPVGAVADVLSRTLGQGMRTVGQLPTLTGRETIPNEGHRLPDGGWEGTFLGLSPAQAWVIRVAVIYGYAFVALAWLWVGYTTFRSHYRVADWTPRDDSINRLRRHWWGLFGLAVVFAFIVMAMWAPSLGPVDIQHNHYQPYQHEFTYLSEDGEVESILHGSANLDTRSQGGASTVGIWSYDQYDRWAPLGTATNGADLFTVLAFGARTSLVIGLIAIGLGTTIALALSLITAYYKGLIDVLTVVTSDAIISIPAFLFVLLISVLFQQADHPIAEVYDGGLLLALIFAAVYWPGLWRSIRGPSLQVAEGEWVDAARSYGQRPTTIMRKHMAPYVATYILIYASLLLGGIIIATAALSFLGLGVTHPTPEWGRIVDQGRSYVGTSAWHVSTVPGLMIVLVVTGFNALGDALRDAIDPESTGGEAGEATAAGGGG